MDENNFQEPEVPRYRWKAYEFKVSSRPPLWYWAMGAGLLAFMGYAFYTEQWLRLAVGGMLAIVVFLVARMQPREFDHSISDLGVRVGQQFYPYGNFKSFAVVPSEDGPKLVFETKQGYKANLTLQLGSADVEKVRALLKPELPEVEKDEDPVDRMNRMLKL